VIKEMAMRRPLLLGAALIVVSSIAAAAGPSGAAPPTYQLDSQIKVPGVDPAFTGDDLYDTDHLDGTISAQVRQVAINSGGTATYKLRVENDGTETDRAVVTGNGGDPGWKVRYHRGSKNITASVTGTGYRPLLDPGERRTIRLKVKADPGQGIGFDIIVSLESRRDGDPGLDDHVRAETAL
jgi:hypothetical protein